MISKKKLIILFLVVFGLFIVVASSSTKKTFWHSYQNAESGSDSSNGLKIEILQEGSGDREVKSGDTIVINYIGALQDGTTLESSFSKGEPLVVQVGTEKVIEGLDEGFVGMKAGERRKVTISPELAYGEVGTATIPSNATLIFEVDLLGIR
ncbi:MAG: FKBP-type peptidyl-prolyl cis-trans isomerase [Candidatus Paceibacterota bacterium]